MTVCVAAMCSESIVFGASDRMLTSGDIQFEPQQPKVWPVTNSIVVQVAGDAAVQARTISSVNADVVSRIRKNPTEWLNVPDVAQLYSYYYGLVRLASAETAILSPLGLDRHTWLARQKDMEPGLVKSIATELKNFAFPSTAAIVSGLDSSGAHIFRIVDGATQCQDTVGFAAIGIGEWHANSQLMFAGHTRRKPIHETLLAVYSAKKRAEVAPGVGRATDMFSVGPTLGSYVSIVPEMIQAFEQIYEREQELFRRANETAKSEVNSYVQELIRRASAQAQTTEPQKGGATSSPSDTPQPAATA